MKRLLDGELRLEDLPAELRAEGEEALRLLAAVDRTAVRLRTPLTAGVMARIRAARPRPTWWRRLTTPRVITLRLRPVTLASAFAAAAALVVFLGRSAGQPASPAAAAPVTVAVRFVLVAPEARQVTVAGTFNQWDPQAAPLVRTGPAGTWTATLRLPAGEHEYAFVVDGVRWVPDPAAPAVDDGFGGGRRNSVLTL
ncbi:MAG: isoamylase early set domain-containing protein [Gemmatimonadales bacterium]